MKHKTNNPDRIGFKDCLGTTSLSTISAMSGVLMSTLFMQYMTDYAGLGAMGATLATTLLFAARIVDAVDDPIQGFIMDSGKKTRIGKYKPFFLISIIMTCIGCIFLYALPESFAANPVLVVIWVVFFYLVYDIGSSFYKDNLLFRTMSNDVNERTKLVIGPRVWTMLMGVLVSMFTVFLVMINNKIGNYHDSFAVLVTIMVGIATILSLIGWFMVKERHVVENQPGDKVKISDFFELFRTNKPMVIFYLKGIFAGFIWTLVFATPTYYIKWGYCTDLTTGVPDMGLFAIYSGISGMMALVPLLFGAILGRPLLKYAFKNNPIRMTCSLLIMQAIGGGILFAAQLAGVLRNSPTLFFVCMFIIAVGVGTDFVPQSVVEMEIMDYNIYKTGKDRSALTMVLGGFIMKAQNAFSAAIVGAILIAIGYQVDSVTSEYVGELSDIPAMLNWFIVIMGLVPAILGVISALILRKYPIHQKERQEIRAFLDQKGADNAQN